MPFGVFVQRSKHYRQDDFNVIANQVAEVLIVPEVQCALSNLEYCVQSYDKMALGREKTYLKMGTCHRLR